MKRAVGLVLVALVGVATIGCAGARHSVVRSQTDFEIAYKFGVEALSDIGYLLSNTDMSSGLIVGRPALEGKKAYSKIDVRLSKTADGVSISVDHLPESGTGGDRGVVEAYVRALKKRMPDIAASKGR